MTKEQILDKHALIECGTLPGELEGKRWYDYQLNAMEEYASIKLSEYKAQMREEIVKELNVLLDEYDSSNSIISGMAVINSIDIVNEVFDSTKTWEEKK
jgi:hypothetical protein